MSSNWPTNLIDRLCISKAEGIPFERAWHMALREFPPSGRDVGEPAESLFEAARAEPSLVEFVYEACRTAWRNERPELANVPVLAEPGDVFPVADGVPARGSKAA